MRLTCIIAAIGVLGALGSTARAGEDLEPPFRVVAGGRPIDVPTGHLAPWLFDMDGDGKRDLLVGQMRGGKLRIYTNVGSDREPRFDDFVPLRIGTTDATVPSG